MPVTCSARVRELRRSREENPNVSNPPAPPSARCIISGPARTGHVAGIWDLRSTIDVYLGEQAFQEKRCLDVGTASGYLALEMERRGAAEVIAVDVSGAERPRLRPVCDRSGSGYADVCRGRCLAAHPAELLGCAWALRSRGPVKYGSIYDLPNALGQFEMVMMGMVLPHLRGIHSGTGRTRRDAARTPW